MVHDLRAGEWYRLTDWGTLIGGTQEIRLNDHVRIDGATYLVLGIKPPPLRTGVNNWSLTVREVRA